MKKIGVITFHSAENSGAALQCVALQIALKNVGVDPFVIDYQPNYIRNQYKVLMNPFAEARKRANAGKLDYRAVLAFTLQDLRFMRKLTRKLKFNKFRKKYMKLSRRYNTYEELVSEPPIADAYIAGSDQIWNTKLTGGTYEPAYFLQFGNAKIDKFTYAISVGHDLSIEDVNAIANLGKDISIVSFREMSVTSRFISQFDSEKYVQNIDPTLLISKSDWQKISTAPKYDKPYILVYALEKSDAFSNIIRDIENYRDYCVIDISQCNLNLYHSVKRRAGFSPDEFLGYIDNADIVITNSFHCTVFSILFHKKFITVPHTRSNGRIFDLLKSVGLENHLYDLDKLGFIDSTDWNLVDSKVNQYRSASLKYLEKIAGQCEDS